MKNIRTGLIIAALTTVVGSTTTFAQQGGSDTRSAAQGAGAGPQMGSGQSDNTSKAPLLGLLGLLGLMGLKRRNERYADDRR